MPINYGSQIQKSGVAVGTVIVVTKSANYNSAADDWELNRFPGYLECDGSALNPNQYYGLYSVIGNTYGGTVTGTYPNLVGTFNIPDYRGKFLMGTGQVDGNSGSSPGLSPNQDATGALGGTLNECGATGGGFVINTVRQLPAGSEITPSTPTAPPTIGGSATDTFEVGTYRTSGFTTTSTEPSATIGGNLSFTVGPLKAVKIFGTPPHGHLLRHCRLINSTVMASTVDGGPGPASDKMPVYQSGNGGIVNFARYVQTDQPPGSGATATVTVSGGVITAVNVTNGGSGYIAPPSIEITSSSTPSSQAVLTAVINTSGQVTGVTINFGGAGYASGTTITFVAAQSAPLRAHSHKIHEQGPGTATWGHDETSGNTGSQSTSYTGVQPGAPDIADTITKTVDIFTDLGVELNDGSITMTDASRSLFDSRLEVKLTSADELPLMQPYFRTKYLIKAI